MEPLHQKEWYQKLYSLINVIHSQSPEDKVAYHLKHNEVSVLIKLLKLFFSARNRASNYGINSTPKLNILTNSCLRNFPKHDKIMEIANFGFVSLSTLFLNYFNKNL